MMHPKLISSFDYLKSAVPRVDADNWRSAFFDDMAVCDYESEASNEEAANTTLTNASLWPPTLGSPVMRFAASSAMENSVGAFGGQKDISNFGLIAVDHKRLRGAVSLKRIVPSDCFPLGFDMYPPPRNLICMCETEHIPKEDRAYISP
jgi:hypothetical protein